MYVRLGSPVPTFRAEGANKRRVGDGHYKATTTARWRRKETTIELECVKVDVFGREENDTWKESPTFFRSALFGLRMHAPRIQVLLLYVDHILRYVGYYLRIDYLHTRYRGGSSASEQTASVSKKKTTSYEPWRLQKQQSTSAIHWERNTAIGTTAVKEELYP